MYLLALLNSWLMLRFWIVSLFFFYIKNWKIRICCSCQKPVRIFQIFLFEDLGSDTLTYVNVLLKLFLVAWAPVTVFSYLSGQKSWHYTQTLFWNSALISSGTEWVHGDEMSLAKCITTSETRHSVANRKSLKVSIFPLAWNLRKRQ